MARMSEEEAYALDDYYTKNPPKVDPRQRKLLEVPDRVSTGYRYTEYRQPSYGIFVFNPPRDFPRVCFPVVLTRW
jgi:hypothetical protein